MNTEKIYRILEFVREYDRKYHRSPTRREIADGTGVRSTSQVNQFLEALEQDGQIEWTRKISRGIVAIETEAENE